MQQPQFVVVVRPKSVEVKPYRKHGMKVGRWGVLRVYSGGKRVQDRDTILAMVGRKV